MAYELYKRRHNSYAMIFRKRILFSFRIPISAKQWILQNKELYQTRNYTKQWLTNKEFQQIMNSANKSNLPLIGILQNEKFHQMMNSANRSDLPQTGILPNKKFHQMMNSTNKSDLPRI